MSLRLQTRLEPIAAPLAPEMLLKAHDRLGGLYRACTPLFHAEAHRLAVQRAALKNGERFLEVGVGSGPTFRPLVLQNPDGENHGVDLSEAMLRRCRAHLDRGGAGRYRLQRADARDLPFPDEHFDLLLCCYLLDALAAPDQMQALREFRRVLRRGGRLVLADMTAGGSCLVEAVSSRLPLLLGGGRPVDLGGPLVELGFRDVSRVVHKRLRFASELLRAVKL